MLLKTKSLVKSLFCIVFKYYTYVHKITRDTSITIGNSVFHGCAFETMTLPESVTSLGSDVFGDNDSLTYLNMANIDDGITEVPAYFLTDCSNLEEVVLPSFITSIDQNAFKDCKALETINLPSGITQIGYFAFSNCDALTSLTLPSALISIGPGAFNSCDGLTSVVIPSNVTTIEYNAFAYCNNLENVTLPDSLERIDSYAFSSIPCTTFVYIGDDAQWSLFKDDRDANWTDWPGEENAKFIQTTDSTWDLYNVESR